jgi:hypothetical protein
LPTLHASTKPAQSFWTTQAPGTPLLLLLLLEVVPLDVEVEVEVLELALLPPVLVSPPIPPLVAGTVTPVAHATAMIGAETNAAKRMILMVCPLACGLAAPCAARARQRILR